MIKRNRLFGSQTRVTFCLPRDTPPGTVSVVGSFNGWQPGEHVLVARRDGTRTVTVRLGPGQHRFRYLAAGGLWFDDESADRVDDQGGLLLL
ncbi:isoamylase early set domain-containing protein [Micromonospora sp. NPDC051196]|uniref:isoamylase early set domain-containing protein n=1 Tax=Micromonospora sp. NPDC051196 TaxID=3155281 RepID=UPI003440244C